MTDSDSRIDYGRFGQLFFDYAVTESRIRHSLDSLREEPIVLGPMAGGPGGMARIVGNGRLQEPSVAQRDDSTVCFDVVLPVDLALSVRFTGITYHFSARLRIPLVLTAEAHRPLLIRLHVAPPSPDNITLRLKPRGRSGAMLARMANMENEIRRQAATYVREEMQSPAVRALCDIDIADRLDKAWDAD